MNEDFGPVNGGARLTAIIDQIDHRCFQTFGTVNCHYPHLVAGRIHLPFDVTALVANPVDKALQASPLATSGDSGFIGQCLGEKLIDQILSLAAEPRQQLPATAIDSQNAGKKAIGRLKIHPAQPLRNLVMGSAAARHCRLAKRIQHGAGPAGSQFNQIIIGEVEKGAFQQ